ILPLGRANNIAKSLGVVGSAERLIAGWRNARHRPFFPIAAEGPWGRQRLVEGLGFGALAQAIDELRGGKLSVEEARRRVAALIMHADTEALDVRADGAAISGLFVVFEVMTIRLVGPNLLLASCADPADGLVLSSVGASIDERQRLAGWLRQPEPVAPAPVTTRTARHVTVSGRPRRIRIDDQVRRNDEGGCETISQAPEEKPLYFLVPI
ncbi:MAG TPA: hypothetical protein VM782_13850, partial [Stellaceae bacterium]|nr:hypothetical protein [Stellaceae bacterium]